MSSLLPELARIVGAPHVITDPEVRASFETDWTGRYSGPSTAAVRPGSTAEVSAVLAACSRAGVAVIPQGGNTGLVGGSVPRGAPPAGAPRPAVHPIVLSLTRLTGPIEVDEDNLVLSAGAGTTLAAAARGAAAGNEAFELGIDLAARDSATLGGMAATNAGGVHVIRHGPMRRRLVGIEAVLSDGTVLRRMTGLWKDNVGLDLPSMLAGSEGTLAVVTAVALRLVPRPAHRVTAMVPLEAPSIGAAADLALRLLRRLRRVEGLEAVELVDALGLSWVLEHGALPRPPGGEGTPAWLVVEASANRDPSDDLASALDEPGLGEIAVAADPAGRARLWAYRERLPEAIATHGIPHKLDVSVPVGRVPQLLANLGGLLRAVAPGAEAVCFGHLGDGNVHVNVLGPGPDDVTVDDAVLRYALGLGGSISAEHGIGMAKAGLVCLARSRAEVDAARRLKAAFDPAGTLNPGVLGL